MKKERFNEMTLLDGKSSFAGQLPKEGPSVMKHQASAAPFYFTEFEGVKYIAGEVVLSFFFFFNYKKRWIA